MAVEGQGWPCSGCGGSASRERKQSWRRVYTSVSVCNPAKLHTSKWLRRHILVYVTAIQTF